MTPDTAHETSDVTDRGLLASGGLVTTLVVAGFVIGWIALAIAGPIPRAGEDLPEILHRAGEPVFGDDLVGLRRAVEAGWAERARTGAALPDGRVRLPLARAVELMLARGFPVRQDEEDAP